MSWKPIGQGNIERDFLYYHGLFENNWNLSGGDDSEYRFEEDHILIAPFSESFSSTTAEATSATLIDLSDWEYLTVYALAIGTYMSSNSRGLEVNVDGNTLGEYITSFSGSDFNYPDSIAEKRVDISNYNDEHEIELKCRDSDSSNRCTAQIYEVSLTNHHYDVEE